MPEYGVWMSIFIEIEIDKVLATTLFVMFSVLTHISQACVTHWLSTKLIMLGEIDVLEISRV